MIADTTTTGTVVVSRPSGNQYLFLRDAAGAWIPDADVPYKLTPVTEAGVRVGWLVKAPDDSEEHYDLTGQLIAITYPSGSAVSLTYTNSRLARVQDHQGRAVELTYVGDLIDTVRLPDGKLVKYGYDTQQRLTSAGFQNSDSPTPQFDTYTYQYDNPSFASALTGRTDETGAAYASWTYDTTGLATRSAHAGGVDEVLISYSGTGSTVTNPLGDTATHTRQIQMGRAKLAGSTKFCIGCGGAFLSRTYDANGYPDVVVDFLGSSTNDDYNSRGLLTQTIEAANDATGKQRTIQTDWHADFRVPTERRTYDAVNALVAKSAYTYNTRGQALTASQIDPVTSATRTTTMAYCEQADVTAGTCPLIGLLKSVDGARTDVTDTTSYTYYPSDDAACATAPATCSHRKGDLWKVTNALGQIAETLAYDGAGRPLSVKDANGVITDLEYHPRGWLTASKTRGTNAAVETDDAITRLEYWPTGLVKKVTQPDNAFTSYTYDAAHRLTEIADNGGNKILYTLDNAGNRTKDDTKDASGNLRNSLARVFDQLGRMQSQKDIYNHGPSFTYDANGNTDTATDASLRQSDSDYDPLDRLSRALQDVGGISAQTQFAYDALDHLIQVTDPKGLNTGYTYNGLGDLTQLVSPDTGTTTYTYDSAGNRKTQVDARPQTVIYTYDALNRLTGTAYSAPSYNRTYTYDTTMTACAAGETFGKGRLTKLTDGSGTTQYCYDRFGNLVRKVPTINGKGFVIKYAYNLAGRLTSVTYPDGAVADYVRDAMGRITEVGIKPAGGVRAVLLNQVAYYPYGPIGQWTYGNGRVLKRTHNLRYEPAFVLDATGSGLDVGFAYDPVGNVIKLGTASQAITAPQITFSHDGLNRLTTTKDGPSGTPIETYAYDATGNRTSLTTSAGTAAYAYPSTNHRLASVGGMGRSYDAVGNTTGIGGTGRVYVYNVMNRLGQVWQDGVMTTSYGYNAVGEQVWKRAGGTVDTYTLYDEAGHWLGDYDSTGAAIQQAIWLDDLPVGLLANSNQLHYIQPDHLGTPRVVIEVARNVPVWTWDLKGEAFGNSAPNQNPDGDANSFVFNLRFPGQRYDPASGLDYNYFRNYDHSVGRYVESDPIGLRGGVSTYGYAGANPIIGYDPDGLSALVLAPPGTIPPPHPLLVAGSIGVGLGILFNYGYESIRGKSPGLDLYDTVHANQLCMLEMGPCGTTMNAERVDDPAAFAEHAAYKARAAQIPPPDLDECERLKWLLKRELDVVTGMQAWDAKWIAGRHTDAIAQRMNGVNKLRRQIEQKCGGCDL